MGWYRDLFLETGRSGALWLLVGFVVTYAVTRWVTTTIRRRKATPAAPGPGGRIAEDVEPEGGPIQDIHIGGVHVHHQVWGILLVLICGVLVIRFDPGPPWLEVTAALFGAGAALALDEFALWLHLEDVYWSEEGRKSIDAVMIAGVVVGVLLIGSSPIGVDDSTMADGTWGALAVALVVHVTFVVITALKGKIITAMVGLPLPTFAFVGAIRLAHPDSFWARRFYRRKPKRLARARARMEKVTTLRTRLRTLVSFGGTFSG